MESACPDEADLAAFLERTVTGHAREALAAHDAIAAHLDTCAACRETIAHVAATEARELGRYRLGRVIGSGGMGVVWEAWDPALERGLAIKVLRPDASDDAGSARLVREARALAKLQHPNVIAIHDVGELAGEVFMATELIDGESMDRWQRGRPPADVIAAYAQAARGLAAAHALGFVHRDVKPANILVARDGRVRIGDFGLAIRDGAVPSEPAGRETSDVRVTHAGAVVGTPAYMAPEQRAADAVDARADQYSLCLALAEALLGKRPGPDPSAAELAASGVAAPWRAIARGLATERGDRHADLQPLIVALDGARPRPRRWWLAIAGVVAAAGITAVLALLPARTDPAAACAQQHPLAWDPASIRDAFAATKLPYARDAAAAAIDALDSWVRELDGEARHACEDAATERQPAELVAKRRACLDRTRAEMVELVAGLDAAPDATTVQRAAVSARALPPPGACATDAGLAGEIVAPDAATAARIDALSARVAKAIALRHLGKLPQARAIAEAVLADARAAGSLPALAEAQHELGTIEHAQHDPAAEHTLEDALDVAARAHADFRAAQISALLVEVVGGERDVDASERQARLARAAIIRAGTDRYLEAVVERGLGHTSQGASQYEPAYDHYKRAEALHAALGLGDDVDFDRRAEVMALGSLDRLDEATRINQQVLASDLAHLGPKHPKTIADITSGGLLQFRAGRYAEAATAFEGVLPIDEEVSGRDSVHAASLRARLASTYQALGRLDDAEPLLRETVRVLAAHLPATDGELRGQRMNLAGLEILRGHYDMAEAELTTLADGARAAKDDETLGLILQNLAEALSRDGKHDLALAAAREAIQRDAVVFGPASRRGAEAHGTLGNVYAARGNPPDSTDAIAEYRVAIEMFETKVGKDTAELGEPLTRLGELYLARGDAAAARPVLERATAVLAAGDPADLARAKAALARLP